MYTRQAHRNVKAHIHSCGATVHAPVVGVTLCVKYVIYGIAYLTVQE